MISYLYSRRAGVTPPIVPYACVETRRRNSDLEAVLDQARRQARLVRSARAVIEDSMSDAQAVSMACAQRVAAFDQLLDIIDPQSPKLGRNC